MTRRLSRARWLPALFLASFQTPALDAEAVFVSTDAPSIGQGWLFRDPAGRCGVVTAAHVVEHGTPFIRTRDGTEGGAASVSHLAPGLDVALIRVTGAIAARGCTSSTLGSSNLTAAIARTRSAAIESMEQNGGNVRRWVDVDLMAQDGNDPNELVVHSRVESIQQGFSGSPLLEVSAVQGEGIGGLPLGLVVRVSGDGRTASAIRFDLIRRLALEHMAATEVRAPSDTAGWRLGSWEGLTSDTACPAAAVLSQTSPCGWRARAESGKHRLMLEFDRAEPIAVSLVHVTGTGASRLVVETAQTSTDAYSWQRSCAASGDDLSCRFGQVVAARIRLTLDVPGGSAEVRSIIMSQ